jgi:hypothetical protein
MAGPDFISGKHVTSRVYFSNQPWNIKVRTTRVEENAVEVEDHVNGEDRARPQKLINLYRVTLECFEDGSSTILQNFLTNQANEDANLPQLPLAAGLLFKFLDGTKGGWAFRECSLGPLNFGAGGRTERMMHTVTFRAKYFGTVPTP